MQRLPALRAADLGVGQLPAGPVPEEYRRAGVAGSPAVPPGGDRHQHLAELLALAGERVLVAGWSLGIWAPLQHPLLLEPGEALGEHLAGDAEPALDIVEAGGADPDVPDDERRPGLARDVERAGNGAGHVTEAGSLHVSILAHLGSLKELSVVGYVPRRNRTDRGGERCNFHPSSHPPSGSSSGMSCWRRRRRRPERWTTWPPSAAGCPWSGSTRSTSSRVPTARPPSSTCSKGAASSSSTTSCSARAPSVRARAARRSPTTSATSLTSMPATPRWCWSPGPHRLRSSPSRSAWAGPCPGTRPTGPTSTPTSASPLRTATSASVSASSSAMA